MKVERVTERSRDILDTLARVIVGKGEVLERILAGILANGHVLIEDYPGLAKTLIARLFAQALDLSFKRLQCTPDLLPADVTGSFLFDQREAKFEFRPGPVFTHLLLADEINRATPKTQAALLEAMQEAQVTVEGESFRLEPPFLVIATQNPIELEGTYPLPEAQLDRFMLDVILDYLPEDEEVQVVRATTSPAGEAVRAVVSRQEILAFQQVVRRVPVADAVTRYAVKLIRLSRPVEEGAPDFIKQWVAYGASVRAAQALVLGGKARALLQGRAHVTFDDVRALAGPVFRHRILLNFQAQSEKITTDHLVERLLAAVPLPRSGL